MHVVNRSKIEVLERFNYGSFSDVYKAVYDGKLYCYKRIIFGYSDDVINNILKLTDMNLPREYVIPKIGVETNGWMLIGYLTELLTNTVELGSICEIKKISYLLEKLKLMILKLHQDYGIIHGDISPSNVLVNTQNDELSIIDFDSSLRFGQKLGSNDSFSVMALEYLQRFPIDYKLDIYEFNLLTLQLFSQLDADIIEERIKEDTFHFPGESTKKLDMCRRLIIDKPNSGEFLIDYF